MIRFAHRAVLGACLLAFGALAVSSSRSSAPSSSRVQLGGFAVPSSAPRAPHHVEPSVVLGNVEQVSPRHVAPRPHRSCVMHALNVAHVHSTNTDVRIKGDGAVMICSWSAS